ncbi:hypothetical protein [Cohnella panacarvi]|nr:hypothetical protein [Cohnella panacarvi]
MSGKQTSNSLENYELLVKTQEEVKKQELYSVLAALIKNYAASKQNT